MHVDVTVRGEVPDEAKRLAQAKVGALDTTVKAPLLGAHVVLTVERNRRQARPARAEGEVNVAGRPIRARVAAATMPAAVDALAEHLHRQLRRYVERLQESTRRGTSAAPGEWFHGAWSPPRPEYLPRPPAEREIVRRKSFALARPQSVAEAAADLAALDHDFFLFRDAATGDDAVLFRRDDARLGLIAARGPAARDEADGVVREPSRFSGPIDLAVARGEMDELDHRFLLFVDRSSGRANVIYLRHDGHYGLIEPASS